MTSTKDRCHYQNYIEQPRVDFGRESLDSPVSLHLNYSVYAGSCIDPVDLITQPAQNHCRRNQGRHHLLIRRLNL